METVRLETRSPCWSQVSLRQGVLSCNVETDNEFHGSVLIPTEDNVINADLDETNVQLVEDVLWKQSMKGLLCLITLEPDDIDLESYKNQGSCTTLVPRDKYINLLSGLEKPRLNLALLE